LSFAFFQQLSENVKDFGKKGGRAYEKLETKNTCEVNISNGSYAFGTNFSSCIYELRQHSYHA